MNKNFVKTLFPKLGALFARNFFLTLGAISALLLLTAGIGGYFITGAAPIDEWGMTWITPDNEAANSLDDKIEQLKQEVDEAAEGEELTLEITEEEATSKLYRLAIEGNLSVEMERPQVYFSDGMVRAFAIVDLGIEVEVAVKAEIGAAEGKPDITIDHLNLGRIPIPKTLINNVMTALERGMEEEWEELPVGIQDITIEPGVMTITLVKE